MEPLADAGGFLLLRANLARGGKEAFMAYVSAPNDLNRIKTKLAFNLTKRHKKAPSVENGRAPDRPADPSLPGDSEGHQSACGGSFLPGRYRIA